MKKLNLKTRVAVTLGTAFLRGIGNTAVAVHLDERAAEDAQEDDG